MTISIVIVTYKRPEELTNCLHSILKQSILPQEVIVIDNGVDAKTKKVAETFQPVFKKKGVGLLYRANTEDDSLTVARNIGVKLSKGQLISMVDDDIVLDKDYHKEILKVLRENPSALAVQGYDQTARAAYFTGLKLKGIKARFLGFYNRVFQTSFLFEKGVCRVLPSLCVTYPTPDFTKPINCQWLSGAAAVYKREVLEEFPFDEKLKRFAWCIDEEHPYRIFKKYPKGLFITPHAKWTHKASPKGRLIQKEFVYMTEIYELYTFYKVIDQTLKNKFLFLWRKLGTVVLRKILFNLVTLGRGRAQGLYMAWYYTQVIFVMLKHRREIKNGDLEFFNRTLS